MRQRLWMDKGRATLDGVLLEFRLFRNHVDSIHFFSVGY